MTTSDPATVALERAQALIDVVAETHDDFARMPIFVRPMVKRGFAKRTGRTIDQWRDTAIDLVRTLDAVEAGDEASAKRLRGDHIDITAALDLLADNYRTAPERAARFMRRDPAALAHVEERSSQRERAVRALIEALSALRRSALAD